MTSRLGAKSASAAAARFDTVLVANRGEIALRVIRSVASAGLRSVAVYSDADRDAPHVRAADEAVRIGPAPSAQSYLSVSALLDAAERTGAGAVHPGYGFLSESAGFARAIAAAGLVFIGPPAAVMDAMGRKDEARRIAIDAGVPVLPAAQPPPQGSGAGAGRATLGSDQSDGLDTVAEQIGFPLLVKAVAGGGGKGMRVVRSARDLAEAVAAARREAAAAFGDDAMLFERYVEHGRHIEVQVLGDEHGDVVHLFERDCSVQRRHQKVIEEAPASLVSEAVRERVRSAAVALARRVSYVNAGTVEFLVDGEKPYFLEMNTRLQVEHPVTEEVTGLDLVALQIAIAQGEPLPFRQGDVAVRGHAIEARVYAEDPFNSFLPQAGVAQVVEWPAAARVDAALESGQRVGTSYDPMLGKVTAVGSSREAARRSLVAALDDTAILGLTTNVGFLRSLADSAEYRDARIDTAWLDDHAGSLTRVEPPDVAWHLAAWALATADDGGRTGPLEVADGWRLAGPPAGIPVALSFSGGEPAPRPAARLQTVYPEQGAIHLDGRDVLVRAVRRAAARLWLEVDQVIEVGHVLVERHRVLVAYQGQSYAFERPDAFGPASRPVVGDGSIVAPMPGTVLAVHVAVGAVVGEGDTLAVMEAMKMELALKAPFAGTVSAVDAGAGDQVDLGSRLVMVEPEASLSP